VKGTAVDPGLGDGPAGDLVGDPTGRRPVLADRTLAFRHLRGDKDRRFSVNNVLLLTEERDRRLGGTSAIGCVLRAPADRT
jgi:hypothetical protein